MRKQSRSGIILLFYIITVFISLAAVLFLHPFQQVRASEYSDTLRNIYSTESGNDQFSMADAADYENAQSDSSSTSTYFSEPHALRLKFTVGSDRDIVGIRFNKADSSPDTFTVTPQMRIAGGLEFWVNPQAVPHVPSFSVGLVSSVSGIQVETRLPISKYLKSTDFADKWTRVVIPFRDFIDMGFAYDPVTKLSTPQVFDWSKVVGINFFADTTASGYYDPSIDNIRFVNTTIKPISVQGQSMVSDSGDPIRFWGMNLAAVYPTHQQADNLAANLSSRGINAVRLHHLMRTSLDWNSISKIGTITGNSSNTRDPNTEAWDRFDYLNAQLRAQGIYIQLSLDSSRRFLPGDADIKQTTDQDRSEWMAAVTDLNKVPSNVDLVRILPMIDERAALLMEEFARNLLTHVNPYTGIAYGNDPQVLYMETMNETSSEYAIVAGNKFVSTSFPAVSYWNSLLQNKWSAYTAAHGIAPCDIYNPPTDGQKLARGDFLRELDQNYFERMKNVVRGLNVQTPMIFSNLWRGESFQKMQSSESDLIEDHNYVNPLVVNSFNDVFQLATRSSIAGKPYFIGELNQQEKDANLTANAPYRTMLLLATSAYGSFNEWSGIDWFAWAHGDHMLGKDGWSMWEERQPGYLSDMIGELESDGMMLDHLRTSGILFKNALTAKSVNPVTMYMDESTGATSYSTLMTPKYEPVPGWQNINSIRRAFGPIPPSQLSAPWMTASPSNPLVSDTGEIAKDTVRKQLTVAAPQAEAFSGFLDGQPLSGLNHLQIIGDSGTATVIAVSNDGNEFARSSKLIISRTAMDTVNVEVTGPSVTLDQIKPSTTSMAWYAKRTRPRGEAGYEELPMPVSGQLSLPADSWHEIELEYAARGSLPVRQSTVKVGDVIRPVFDDAFLISGVINPLQGGFALDSGYAIDPATILAPAEGAKSLRLKLTAGKQISRFGINFTNSAAKPSLLDFTSLTSNAGLHFWVYTKKKVDSFSVLLASDNNGKLVESRVPLSDYLSAADYGNKWVEVTIPFSAFSDTGGYYDSVSEQTTQMPFLWNRVKGVGFYSSTVASGYYDPYIDDIRMVYTSVPNQIPMIDKSELIEHIMDAQSKYGDAIEGILPGQYHVGAKAVLQSTIQAAQVIADKIVVTQQEVDQAVLTLQTAILEFAQSIIPPVDVNGDGRFSIGDIGVSIGYYGKQSTDSQWGLYKGSDMNLDGIIDIEDLSILASIIVGQ
jgi:hypothetical protein